MNDAAEEYEILDTMCAEEEENLSDALHGQRYIGISARNPPLLLNTVQARTFYRYSYSLVVRYLQEYSLMKTTAQPSILQLLIQSDDSYAVCDKTFWLRLVQRRWKRVVQIRKEFARHYCVMQRARGQIQILHLPQLRGLMAAASAVSTSTRIDSRRPVNRREY